ncbi:MAG TPA: SGNH/GDSL hydrolase family protein [Vicinamibacterales bacterium]|nr:SGNH/GDSL hydrolase family protein [Vicinamibacterales bacterium]
MALQLSRRRKTAFVLAAILLPLAAVAIVVGITEYRFHGHGREELWGYVNFHGYRGPVLGRKASGEFRVAMIGGSTVYGQGVETDQTIPAYLEQRLRQSGRAVTVANLGYMADGVYADGLSLTDYRYLDYDLAVLYEGYNDLFNIPNYYSFRHRSLVFRLTGYFPMFPVVFAEKAKSLRYHGDLAAAYRGDRPVVPANPAARASAAALEFAASLDRQMNDSMRQVGEQAAEGACGHWTFYCEHVAENVQTALSSGADVLVVVQPFLPALDDPSDGPVRAALHRSQTESTLSYLSQRFGSDVRLHVLNLGEAIDLRQTTYRSDNLHLTSQGNAVIADRLIAPITKIAADRAHRSQSPNHS